MTFYCLKRTLTQPVEQNFETGVVLNVRWVKHEILIFFLWQENFIAVMEWCFHWKKHILFSIYYKILKNDSFVFQKIKPKLEIVIIFTWSTIFPLNLEIICTICFKFRAWLIFRTIAISEVEIYTFTTFKCTRLES